MKQSTKRTVTTIVALLFICLGRFCPVIPGLNPSAMQVLGIFIGTLILWMTISIDWPSLLCLAAIGLIPEMSMNKIFSSSIGSSTFAFLMFTFMCTFALNQTSFIRRLAIYFLNTKLAKKGSWHFIFFYFFSVLVLGAFISPTVLVVVMITLTEEIFSILKIEKGNKVSNMMMMGMVFTSGIAAGMTPIAHVFPLMAMDIFQKTTNQTISYLDYMIVGTIMAIFSFIMMMLMFKWVYRPDMSSILHVDISHLKESLPKLSLREKEIITIFFIVVGLWILPELFKPVLPELYAYINALGTAFPPLLGVVCMSIITCDGEPLLDFKKAMSNGVPWASLIMVAGTLTLASALTNENIGIITWISNQITPLTYKLAPLALIFLFMIWASVQTNLSSNMVTVTVVSTIAIPLTLSLNTINVAALCSMIGMMASYAFATPPAMATIAFAIGSGWTTAKDMAKYGFILMFITVVLATFIGYPIASLLMI